MDSDPNKGVVLAAAISLVAFTGLTGIALVAWFLSVDEPWSFRAAVATFSAILGLTATVLVWRAPSRTHLVAGIGVMALSLLRVGPPLEWGWTSLTLLLTTALLIIPLVHAAVVIKR